MATIWKWTFPVRDQFTLMLPVGAKVLSAQIQDGAPTLWALVDPDAPKIKTRFRLYGTGHKMDEPDLRHVGTFQMEGGALVFHLFVDEQRGAA